MNAVTETRRVVLCADDFGMSQAVNTGIIRLAAQGRLAAASCMTQGPAFEADAQALADTGAQTGLHLNFTEPLGNVQPGELYLPLAALIRRAYCRRLDRATLRFQIGRQLDRFEYVLGRPPHFVDGHQHIHQLPVIRDVLLDTLQQRYNGQALPWLRSTHAVALRGSAAAHRRKAVTIQMLGAAALTRRARHAGFGLNARFAGVYDFQGGEAAYRVLFAQWLSGMHDGDVLMCHPAAHLDKADPMGTQRVAEFNVLSSDEAGHWLQQYKIQPRLDTFKPGET